MPTAGYANALFGKYAIGFQKCDRYLIVLQWILSVHYPKSNNEPIINSCI
jgi:hypothetical protein